MKTKIGINGFGRIGRNAFKIAFERPDLEIVAVNDLTDTKTLAHLLKHDSNYGAYQYDVGFDEQHIIVKDQKIKVLSEKDPAKLPWKDLGVEVVIESTGLFTDPAKAKAHIEAGAKKVIISAPAKGDGADTIAIEVHRTLPPVLKELKAQSYRLVGLEQTTHSQDLHHFLRKNQGRSEFFPLRLCLIFR